MATDPTINIRGDASSLVNAINQATTAFIGFETATASIQKDLAKFDKDGNILSRTLLAIDAAGNKLRTTLDATGKELTQTTTVTKAAATSLAELATTTTAAAEAAALLTKASAINVDGLRAEAAALSQVAAAAGKEADRLAASAQASLEKSETTLNSANARRAAEAAERKFAASAREATTAEIASAEASKVATAALIAEAEAISLRNQAARVAEGGQRAAALSGLNEDLAREHGAATRQAQKDAADFQAKQRAAFEAAEKERLASIAKVEAARIAAAEAEAAAILAEVKAEEAFFAAAEAKRLAQIARVENARIAAAEREAAAILAETKAEEAFFAKAEQERLEQIARVENARIAAAEREAAAILAETKAEEAFFEKAEQERLAQIAKIEKARVAAAKREAAAILAEVKAEEAFFEKAEKERLAQIARVEKTRIAAAEREAAAILAEVKKEEAAFEKLEKERLAAIARVEAARIAAAKREAAAILAEVKKEEAAQRFSDLQTRTPGTDFRTIGEGGRASKAQVQAFVQVEAAAKKLGATTQAEFARVDAAIKKARADTLLLAEATTQAEQAALKLVAAEKAVAKGAQEAAVAAKGLTGAIIGLGKLIGISLLIGGAFRLVTAFTDAARAAGELSIKIAEINTIAGEAGRSTEAWASGLRELSSAFGVDTLKQAEGAYQILSNQIKNARGEVIQGAEALKFLEVANRLAITGVTDTATATNLLTAATNSFKLTAEDAEVISAKLFKTVVLGRVRIQDLSEIFGRVAVPARQLGLSIDEVLGSIAGLTIQGFKADEAITGIRNVILKLIKPTKAGKAALKGLGFETGQSLIQTRGFIQGLTDFVAKVGESGKSVEVFGDSFGRIRAIVGALGLVGENADLTAANIEKIKKASVKAFDKNTQKVIQSTGQQLKIASEQAKNFFEEAVGTPVLKAIAKFIKDAGGVDRILRDIKDSLSGLGKVLKVVFGLTALKLIGTYTIAMKAFAVAQLRAAAATGALAVAQRGLTATLLANPILAIFTGIAVGTALITESARKAALSGLRIVEDANIAILKSQKKNQEALTRARKAATSDLLKEFDKRIRIVREGLTAIRKRQLEAIRVLATAAAKTSEEFKILVKDFRSSVTKQLTVASQAAKKFEKQAKTAGKTVQKILTGADADQFKIDVNIAGFGRRISLLEDEISKARARVEKATQASDIKAFNLERKRLNDLVKQRIDAEVEFAGVSSKLAAQRTEAQLKRERARTQSERRIADDRIRSIDRQQKILREGTSAQLKQEQAIQQLREDVSKADDAASIKKAVVQLNALKREQERINNLALAERRIRAEAAKDRIEQAKQADRIRVANEKAAKAARKRAQQVRALQLLFNLIAKDAEKFRIERVTEGKDAKEINKAVAEQQRRFAQLRTLAGELGGGETQEIFIKREFDLRKQAQAQIDLLESRTAENRVKKLKESGRQRLKEATTAGEREKANLAIITQSIAKFQQLADIKAPSESLLGNKVRLGLGVPQEGDGILDQTRQNKDLNVQFRQIIKTSEILNGLIIEQTQKFTEARQTRIESLVKTITGSFNKSQLENFERFSSGNKRGRDVNDINATTRVFLQEIQKITSSTRAFGDRTKEAAELLNLFPELKARVKSKDSIDAERKARAKSTTALEKSREIIQEIIDIGSGKKRLTKGPTKAPGAVDAAPLSEIVGETLRKPIGKKSREAVRDALVKGTKDAAPSFIKTVADLMTLGITGGLKDGAKEVEATIIQAAKKAGREQAKAQGKQALKQTPELTRQIAQLEASLKKRIAAASQRAATRKRGAVTQTEKPIDATIRLGRGAPSIASQQARIRAEVAARDKRQAALRKAQREAKADERRRQQIAGRERVRADRQTGRLITRGRGNINRRGQLFTRGRGNFDRNGNPISRQRGRNIAPKIVVPKTPEKIAEENKDQNTKARAALEAIRKDGIKVKKGDPARGAAAKKAVEAARKGKEAAKKAAPGASAKRRPGQTGQPTAKTPGVTPGQDAASKALKKALEDRRLRKINLESLKESKVRNLGGLKFAQESDLAKQKKLQDIDPRKRTELQQRELLQLRERTKIAAETIKRLEEDKALDDRIRKAKQTIAEETSRINKANDVGGLDLPVVGAKLNPALVAAQKELAAAEAEKRRRNKVQTPEEKAAAAEKLRLARIKQDADIRALARGEKTPFKKPGTGVKDAITTKTIEAAEKQKLAAELMIQAFQARLPKSPEQLRAERDLQFENAKRGIPPKPITTQVLPFGQFRPAGEIAPAPITNVGGIKVEIIGGTQNPKEIARLVVPEIQRGIRQGLIRLTPSRGRAR